MLKQLNPIGKYLDKDEPQLRDGLVEEGEITFVTVIPPMQITVPAPTLENGLYGFSVLKACLKAELDPNNHRSEFPVAEFPTKKDADDLPQKPIKKPIGTIKYENLKYVATAMSSDENSPILQGVCLERMDQMVATDGRRLLVTDWKLLEAIPKEIIIPAAAVSLALKLFSNFYPINVWIDPTAVAEPEIMLTQDKTRIVCQAVEGIYPEWRSIVKTKSNMMAVKIDWEKVKRDAKTDALMEPAKGRSAVTDVMWVGNGTTGSMLGGEARFDSNYLLQMLSAGGWPKEARYSEDERTVFTTNPLGVYTLMAMMATGNDEHEQGEMIDEEQKAA